jgi:hypothetical protein
MWYFLADVRHHKLSRLVCQVRGHRPPVYAEWPVRVLAVYCPRCRLVVAGRPHP